MNTQTIAKLLGVDIKSAITFALEVQEGVQPTKVSFYDISCAIQDFLQKNPTGPKDLETVKMWIINTNKLDEPDHDFQQVTVSVGGHADAAYEELGSRFQRPIEKVYLGLPDHLVHRVQPVAREYRTNPLSHEPGGFDIVVEYKDGDVLLYDWIKRPSAYVAAFFSGGYELADKADGITRIFLRKYLTEEERPLAEFREVWNSVTSLEHPVVVLKAHDLEPEKRKSYEEEFPYRPMSKREYYGGSIPVIEDPVDKAMRLFDIPDPRLLDDYD